MSQTVLVLITVGAVLTALTAIVKLGIVPIYRTVIGVAEVVTLARKSAERLTVVEKQTRQLEHNGGSHFRDEAAATAAAVSRIEEKVDSHVTVWTEQQAVLRDELVAEKARVASALETQAAEVRIALEAHSTEVDREFLRVWRELGTRDIHRSVDLLTDAADRAERAIPPTDPKGTT